MSLINDALKRAKQAQAQAQAQASPSVAAGPQLRPVESIPQAHKPLGLLLPAALLLLIGIGLFLVWGRFHTTAPSNANTNPQIVNNTTPASAPELSAIQPAKAVVPAQKTATEPSAKEQGETVVFGPPSGGQSLAPNTKSSVPEPAIKAQPIEKSGAASSYPFRLTGIVFHPTHPAAMIGGKMLFINDKVGEWRVVAIDRESATLSNAGQTNVLTLAP